MAAPLFKDHFSVNSGGYKTFRPTYPDSLFAYLASLTPARDLAWDCATGSGQAALGLAGYFSRVVATDGSPAQISRAISHERIEYRVGRADVAALADHTVDLVTVAQALHWFDPAPFYREVNRVLRPGGVIGVWTYNLLTISPEIDELVGHLYGEVLDGYWPPERRLVESGYAGILFPFAGLTPPPFAMSADWTVDQLLGYLGTWSAVSRFRKKNGNDPLRPLEEDILTAWGEPEAPRKVSWPLSLLVGKKG